MARFAQLDWWVDSRTALTDALLLKWSEAAIAEDNEALASCVTSYLNDVNLDDVEVIDSPSPGSAIFGQRMRAGGDAPTVLIVGCLDLPKLNHTNADDAPRIDDQGLIGAGIASRFGSLVAHIEGFLGVSHDHEGQPPTNLQVLMISSACLSNSSLDDVLDAAPIHDIDVIVATHGVAWDLDAPTITLGARGELVIEIEMQAGRDLQASTFAGTARNPLTTLVELLGDLRSDNGRILLPGFYHRAVPPTDAERAALLRGGYDASSWLRATGATGLTGGPSALERSSLWPSADILDVTAGATGRIAAETMPGSAKATIAFQLVPDQVPSEVESSLRNWIDGRSTGDLDVTVTSIAQATPFQVLRDTPWVVAQARALKRICGSAPIPVVSGGAPGYGEIAEHVGAAMLYSAFGSPANNLGTTHERLSRSRFRTGVNLSGELFEQFRKRRSSRTRSLGLAQGA